MWSEGADMAVDVSITFVEWIIYLFSLEAL
jgi:hypothetical protein